MGGGNDDPLKVAFSQPRETVRAPPYADRRRDAARRRRVQSKAPPASGVTPLPPTKICTDCAGVGVRKKDAVNCAGQGRSVAMIIMIKIMIIS